MNPPPTPPDLGHDEDEEEDEDGRIQLFTPGRITSATFDMLKLTVK
jgi:hypothetical protein